MTNASRSAPWRSRFAVHVSLASLVLILAAVSGVATLCCSPRGGVDSGRQIAQADVWYCPMHPTYTSDRAGDCPICHMRLVKLDRSPATAGATGATAAPNAPPAPFAPGSGGPAPGSSASPAPAPSSGRRTVYRSTMNPGETSDRPGKDSMGMEMVPVEVGGEAPSGTPGWSEVVLPPERLQQSGVTFGTAATKRMARTLRTSGRIAFDEARLHHVHTKLSGWIEHLAADTVGEAVRQGDPLFEIYAPELLASQEEYLQTVKAEGALGASSDPDLARAAHELREAARRRLALWDFGSEAIARLEASGQVTRTVTIRSPISGVITAKEAVHGMYADPSTILYTIADLSHVWVLADVYENELSLVRVGSPVEVRLPYDPDVVRRGRVELVSPVLDPATRTARVRVGIDNTSLVLRPDMFADVLIATDAGDRTVVPKTAVIHTGERSIVFMDRGEGRLLPREIRTGLTFDDDIEVLSGLAPGERIVTSATFLIDAESRLRAAVGGAAAAASSGPVTPPVTGEPR